MKYLKHGCVFNCKTDDAEGPITRHDNVLCISSCKVEDDNRLLDSDGITCIEVCASGK